MSQSHIHLAANLTNYSRRRQHRKPGLSLHWIYNFEKSYFDVSLSVNFSIRISDLVLYVPGPRIALWQRPTRTGCHRCVSVNSTCLRTQTALNQAVSAHHQQSTTRSLMSSSIQITSQVIVHATNYRLRMMISFASSGLYHHDIALLILRTPINYTVAAQPVCLQRSV